MNHVHTSSERSPARPLHSGRAVAALAAELEALDAEMRRAVAPARRAALPIERVLVETALASAHALAADPTRSGLAA